MNDHPLLVLAPWYRWPLVTSSEFGSARLTAPVLQKFTTDVFVDRFISEPQRSYAFVPSDQTDHRVIEGKAERLGRGALRTLYQPTHDRLYLVVCEVVCDVEGFPAPHEQRVCQAGFVTRRLRLRPTDPKTSTHLAAIKVLAALKDLAATDSAARSVIGDTYVAVPGGGTLRFPDDENAEAIVLGAFARGRRAAPTVRDEISKVFTDHGARLISQRWNLGHRTWEDVPATEELESPVAGEPITPMAALIGNGDPNHDATGRRQYFATIPTASAERDRDNRPRYDSTSVYEVRCFVRRHDCRCPRRTDRQDCEGPVTWGQPTEPFRLAAASDAIGTGQRSVTIEMPDLRNLKARALSGRVPAGVRFQSAPKSSTGRPLSDSVPSSLRTDFGGPEIWFESIPLITLVARFVMGIFMGIVMFVFQAWWMLKLRFRIGGNSVSELESAVNALKAVLGSSVEVDLSQPTQLAAWQRARNLLSATEAVPDEALPFVIPVIPEPPGATSINIGAWLTVVDEIMAAQNGSPLLELLPITRAEVGLA